MGLQAPNRAQDLRTWFEPTGIRVQARSDTEAEALVALRWEALGRAGHRTAVGAARIGHAGPRVELRRPDGLVEWYENRPDGLEQGFTLAARPPGRGRLELALAVEGASARARGPHRLVLSSRSGRALGYGGLHAFDADGTALEASFSAETPQRVVLAVEDEGARYPITIDPLLTEEADTELSSSIAGEFGWSVASAGDVNGDGFEDVVVGAWQYDRGQTNEGAVFVFLGSESGIPDSLESDAATLIESNQNNAQLGSSVASAGDVNGDGYDDVIAGAWFYDDGENNEGAAFVFLGGPGGIPDGDVGSASARLQSDQSSAQMARSVASAGDVNGDGYDDVIVGASHYDSGQTNEGAAFVVLGGPGGIPSGSASEVGSQLESNQATALMGWSVASAGDVNGDGYDDVIAGGYAYHPNFANEGGAFVFLGGPNGVPDGTPLTADGVLVGGQLSAQLGTSVASAGDVNGDGYDDVIVGAPFYDVTPQDDAGAAFVFLGGPAGIVDAGSPGNADTQLDGTGLDFGRAVAGVGDVDDDGYDDVIVGAPGGIDDYGQAFVYRGGPDGVPDGGSATAAFALTSLDQSAFFGSSVGSADVNGDRGRDVLVGAYGASSTYVYLVPTPVPEPGAAGAGGAALATLAALARRRGKVASARCRVCRDASRSPT